MSALLKSSRSPLEGGSFFAGMCVYARFVNRPLIFAQSASLEIQPALSYNTSIT